MIDILRRIPIEWITSAELTGDMESKLDGVQRGTNQRDAYMSEIRSCVQELVDKIRDHDRSELYSKSEPIGSCPLVNRMLETILSYICETNEGRDKGCSFVMWKDASGRWFDKKTASRLLQENQLRIYTDFLTKWRWLRIVLTSTIAEKL